MADTPDQRPDDMNAEFDRSALPSELWPLHERLAADGARWRRRAPDGQDLSRWARAALVAAPSAMELPDSRLRERRLDAHDEHLSPPKGPRIPMDSPNTSPHTRWRGIAGALAATVVVGLLATLFALNIANRGTGASATVTSTPGPTGTPRPPTGSGTSLQPGLLPVVAPSDPQIVYRVANNIPQRSTDGGKTYSALPLPTTDITPIDDVWIAVSPLDPTHVFLTVSGQKNGQGCLPPAPPSGSLASSGDAPFIGAMLSGYTDCSEQFYSSSSGHSWTQLHLHGGDVLGGTILFRAIPGPWQGPYQASAYVFQAQGTRLYAGAGFAAQGGAIMASVGARLMTSVDGGATWSLIDQPIISQGLIACDFAATPSGSTIYAAVTNQSCGNEGLPAMSLWRSDNAGQSWMKVSNLPSPAEGGMLVSNSGALYIFEPSVQSASHAMTISLTPQYALVSLDKGATFYSAPTAGLSAKAKLVGPVGVLSDGAAIYRADNALYSWKAGSAAWTKLTGLTGATLGAVIVTPNQSGGDTLTITDASGGITTVKVSG